MQVNRKKGLYTEEDIVSEPGARLVDCVQFGAFLYYQFIVPHDYATFGRVWEWDVEAGGFRLVNTILDPHEAYRAWKAAKEEYALNGEE